MQRRIRKSMAVPALTKRTAAIGIAVCIFFVYFGPYYLRSVFMYFSRGSGPDKCMNMHLKQREIAVGNLDAYVNEESPDGTSSPDRNPLPFIGNGKLAAVVKELSGLYLLYQVPMKQTDIKGSTVMKDDLRSFELPFKPILSMKPRFISSSAKTSSIVNFREGIVEKISCLKAESHSECVFVNHTVIAHRSRPNVFLQHVEASFDNKTPKHIIAIDVVQNKIPPNFRKMEKKRPDSYDMYTGIFEVSNGEFMAVSMAMKRTGDALRIGPDGKNHIDVVTVVVHSKTKSSKALAKNEETGTQKRASDEAALIMKMSADELLAEHKAAWKDILHTGLTISTSGDEPGLPSPISINETIYYLLSTSDSKLHDEGIPEAERRNLIRRLQTPEFCYHGNPTFHGHSLWPTVTSVEEVVQLQKRWSLTLSKNQCKSLVSEGAEGLLQALLLSFGGLKFTESDLRLNMDPMVLHNDIYFHRLIYRNDTIDISIKRRVGEETPVIFVHLHGPPKIPLYACEAGCVHDAVELGIVPRELPVFVTNPVTAILYISHDKTHLKDLRDTIHVKTRVDHAQHMEDVKKGTGLPTIFWVGIGSLIIFFHLFLIRLIWKEYKSSYSSPTYYGGGKYSKSSPRGRLVS